MCLNLMHMGRAQGPAPTVTTTLTWPWLPFKMASPALVLSAPPSFADSVRSQDMASNRVDSASPIAASFTEDGKEG
jgi:hypothetical protein